MSDTPRTDEQINGKSCTRFQVLAGDSLRNASVPSEFARQLERELNAANDRIKRLEEMYEGVIGERPEFLVSNVMGLLKRELTGTQKRIKELEDRIHRAAMAFFRDGSDGHIASQMLQILEEERGKK